ncbi:mRNA-binding ribosome synthesis protein nop7 [Entomophthora muscae]|uniref:mRNA-binding ribosome synthesis protein nop7 n=2 Tax=Entomophthora muscae TaxID=34485 RepID=A0ACC2UBH7_9FUNG|nr:mRNA-binding ribosome synthesis protein nop7 [Entomophthora muscae]
MGRIKKKGESGIAVKYITRNKAVKKLQISLFDFRRLCILKGIHPHEPKNKKKALKGSTANRIFYYAKDISLINHDPILDKMREKRAFYKKIKRALAKKQTEYAKDLKSRAPKYTLDHLVKERYPSFVDALRDLDDALSMVFLFATMPPAGKCPASVVAECQQLSREFLHFVIHSRALRKVFLSIKGIYYQAEARGQIITWLVPYQFCQKAPRMVDFKVMSTFLEFYRVLLGFVNFRLFSDLNLQYPPALDENLEAGSADLAAMLIRAKDSLQAAPSKPKSKPLDAGLAQRIKSLNKKLGSLVPPSDMSEEQEAVEEEEAFKAPENEEGGDSDEVLKAFNESSALTSFQSLFAHQSFFLSREVPRNSLEFVIRAFGGKVGWDSSVAAGSPYDSSSPAITYIITDRAVIPDRRTDCIYVQPQWIYDSINAKKLLKESPYFPGSQLPPHLSPFVEYKDGDYVPDEAFKFQGEIDSAEVEAEAEQDEESDEESDDSADEDETYMEELHKEVAGTSFSESKPAPKPATKANSKKRPNPSKEASKVEEVDVKEMGKVMMTKKQKYLAEKFQKNSSKKEAAVNKLLAKKEALKKKK